MKFIWQELNASVEVPPKPILKGVLFHNTPYKLHFHETTAFIVATVEDPNSTPANSEYEMVEEVAFGEAEHTSEDAGGLCIPEFLGEAKDGVWGLTIRMAWAIQADEKQQKKCFVCQSPHHFARELPPRKKCQKAPAAEGASKNKIGSSSGQGKCTSTKLSTHSAGISVSQPGKVRVPARYPVSIQIPLHDSLAPKIEVKL